MTSRSLAPIYTTASTGPLSTFLLGLVVLSNTCCTVNTGTRISLSRSDVERINKIGICTRREKEFSVLLSRTKAADAGWAIGGMAGVAVIKGVQSARDAKLERGLKPAVASFAPEQTMQQTLCQHLQQEKLFDAAVAVFVEDNRSKLHQRGIDAVLQIAIREWGLRLCPTMRSEEDLAVALDVEIKLFMRDTNQTVWHRSEIYVDGRCYSFDVFLAQPELLTQLLTEAIEELCKRITLAMVYS